MPLVTVNGTTYNLNTNGPRAWNHTGNDWAQAISAYVANIQSGFIDLVALGADPTGTTDATTIIQSAIATAISTGKAISGQGTFLISDSITIADCYGLRLLGSGAYGFKLKWGSTAPSGRPMVLVKNAQQIWLDQLGFIGNANASHRPSAYIESRSDTTYTRTYVPTALRVINCDLGNADNQATDGIVLSNAGTGSDTNNDFGFFQNVRCYYTTVRAQVSIQHSQSVEHQFYNCFFVGGQYGISNGITGNGGGFRVEGGGYGSHSIADFQVVPQGAQGTFTIKKVNSEGSDRFLVQGGIGDANCAIHLEGNRYANNIPNADTHWVVLSGSGPLICEANELDNGSSALPTVYVNNASSNPVSVAFRHNSFVMPGSDRHDPVVFNGASANRGYYIEVTGNQGRTASDQAAKLPDYVKSNQYTGPIDVRLYGATGVNNAAVDDSAAVTAALTLAASTGREIIFPAGTYRFNVSLPTDFNYSIVMRGEGSSVDSGRGTIFWPFTAGTDLISQADTVFCNPRYVIENVILQGPDTGAGTTSGHGIKIAGTHGVPVVTLRNVVIRDFRGSGKAGLYMVNPEDSTFDSVSVTHCDTGVDVGGGATGAFNANTFNNLSINLCVTGMKIDGSASCVMVGGAIQSNEKTGLRILGASGWTFLNTHFENNNTSATAGEGALRIVSSSGHSTAHIRFIGCRFGAARDNIDIQGAASYTASFIKFDGGYCNSVTAPIITTNVYCINIAVEDFVTASQVSNASDSFRLIETATSYQYTPGLSLQTDHAVSRRILNGTAAPTSGAWVVGEIVFNTAPTAGGTIGWVCTTAGSPGTWKTFGTIAA